MEDSLESEVPLVSPLSYTELDIIKVETKNSVNFIRIRIHYKTLFVSEDRHESCLTLEPKGGYLFTN